MKTIRSFAVITPLLFCAALFAEAPEISHPLAERLALSYPLKTENKLVELDRLRGKVIVVTFCTPSNSAYNKMLPDLAKVVDQFKDKPVVFLFVGTKPGDGPESLYQLAQKYGGNAFADGCLWTQDADGLTQKLFLRKPSISGTLWFSYVIDPSGEVQFTYDTFSYIPPGDGFSFDRAAIRREVEHMLPDAKFITGELPDKEPLKTLTRRFEQGDYSVFPLVKSLLARKEYKDAAVSLHEKIVTFADNEIRRAKELEDTGYKMEPYRIYSRFAGKEFSGTESNKNAQAGVNRLKDDREIKAGLLLDQAMDLIATGKAPIVKQGWNVIAQVAAQYKDTKTGALAEKLK